MTTETTLKSVREKLNELIDCWETNDGIADDVLSSWPYSLAYQARSEIDGALNNG